MTGSSQSSPASPSASSASRRAAAATAPPAAGRTSTSGSSTSRRARSPKRPRTAATRPTAATRSPSTRSPTTPTPSASRSSAGSPPRTTASTSSAWTSSGPRSSPRPSWIKPWAGADAAQDPPGHAEGPAADGDLQGQAVGRAGEHEHAAALVPQGPRQEPGRDLGRADRPGGEAAQGRHASRSRARSTRASPSGSTRSSPSAGGTIVDSATRSTPGRRVADGRRDHAASSATSKAADPSLRAAEGGPDAPRVRARRRRVPGQLPVHLSERQGGQRRRSSRRSAWKPYPARRGGQAGQARRSAASTGASAATPSTRRRPSRPRRACATRQNQRVAATKGGLPPTLAVALRRPKFKKDYPFADLIRKQVDSGAVRPQTPGLRRRLAGDRQDASRRRRRSSSKGFVDDLRDKLQDALDSKGLHMSETAADRRPRRPPRGERRRRSALTDRARAERKLGLDARARPRRS